MKGLRRLGNYYWIKWSHPHVGEIRSTRVSFTRVFNAIYVPMMMFLYPFSPISNYRYTQHNSNQFIVLLVWIPTNFVQKLGLNRGQFPNKPYKHFSKKTKAIIIRLNSKSLITQVLYSFVLILLLYHSFLWVSIFY